MSKPPHKKHQLPRRSAQPPTAAASHLAQVLERAQALLNAGNVDEAISLLEANQGRLSQFAPFRAALATLYGEVGREHDAAVQARLAVDLDPRHADYYLLAAISYYAAGFRAFAHRARQEWLRATPAGSLLAEMRELEEVYRQELEEARDRWRLRDLKVAEEASYRLDEGRWAMEQRRFAEALKHAQAASALAPGWPPPRNNTALALYYLGRQAEAISTAEAVLRDCDPDNLHALANLVNFHVIANDLKAARDYADRLARLPLPDSPADLVKQIEGLAFLDRDEDIDRIVTACAKKFGRLPGRVHVHWGIAAANAGNRKVALTRLEEAQEQGFDSPLLQSTLEALQRGQSGPGSAPRFPQTHFSDLMREEPLQEAGQLLAREEKTGKRDDRAWADLLRRYPQLPFVTRRLLYETAPGSVAPMTQLLIGLRTPEATETLREFVTGQIGSDEERMTGLRMMQQANLLPADGEIEMWIRGKRQPVRAMLQEISDRFIPDYAPEVWQFYEQAVTAQRENRMADAERLYEAMLKIEPNAKEAYNNLAMIYQARGETARMDAAIEKALAIDPLYPFPRTARALQALNREGVEAARKWLEPLQTTSQWHPLGFVVYQKALARIAMAEKDYEAARRCLDAAQQINEDDREIPGLLKTLGQLENLAKAGDWFAGMDTRYRERRQRAPLPADPSLDDCLGTLTKGDMVGISHVVQLGSITAFKKAELCQHLLMRFSDASFVSRIVSDLDAREHAALRDLLDRGGLMPYDAFTQTYGKEDERPYLEYHAATMKSVLGRLRARGLLFVGTIGGRVIVAIPRELRPLLREALEKVERSSRQGAKNV